MAEQVQPLDAQTMETIQTKLAGEFLFRDHDKKDLNIVIVGLSGSGKSSLINTLCRGDMADVGDGATPCQHEEYVKEYLLRYANTTMHIYDTRGFSDPFVKAKQIFGKMRRELKNIDLLLICHKLYGKVDAATYEMGKKFKEFFGKEIFKHAVIVLTQADEYKSHTKSSSMTEEISEGITKRIDSMKQAFQAMLVDHLKVAMDCFSNIPVCVSSYNDQKLPTTDCWESDLWNRIARRCSERAIPLLGYLARHWRDIKLIPKSSHPDSVQVIGEANNGTTTKSIVLVN